MAKHLEIELKWALDADGHARLLTALTAELGPPRLLEQRNRFLDSADLRLRHAGLNLRLRQEDGRLLMTCKRRADATTGDGGLHRHDEWEEWLDPALSAADPATLASRLPLPAPHRDALGGAALVDLGGFANRRAEFHARRGAADDLLCLDRTDFNGRRTDHELEIETADPAGAATHWGRRLADWNIAWHPEARTKFARFLVLAGTEGPRRG